MTTHQTGRRHFFSPLEIVFYILLSPTLSNVSVSSLAGSLSIRLTTYMASSDKINPGTISYSPRSSNCFQTNTVIPPTTMPATAPFLVVLLQNRDMSIAGPKAAPKPAQAYETVSSIKLL